MTSASYDEWQIWKHFHRLISEDLKKTFAELYKKEMTDKIESEEFIDTIVDRIKRKQL